MARGRMLSKTLSVSKRFNSITGELAEFSQLLFTLLVPHVDDFGRMSGDPFSLKMTVLPASSRPLAEFSSALETLHAAKLITVYDNEGDIWIQVNKFEEHQIGLHKRTASKIPPPNGHGSGNFPEIPGNSGSRARAELNRTELKRREEKITCEQLSKIRSKSNGDSRTLQTELPEPRHRQISKRLAAEILSDKEVRRHARRFR
jgi:hypothetical protein